MPGVRVRAGAAAGAGAGDWPVVLCRWNLLLPRDSHVPDHPGAAAVPSPHPRREKGHPSWKPTPSSPASLPVDKSPVELGWCCCTPHVQSHSSLWALSSGGSLVPSSRRPHYLPLPGSWARASLSPAAVPLPRPAPLPATAPTPPLTLDWAPGLEPALEGVPGLPRHPGHGTPLSLPCSTVPWPVPGLGLPTTGETSGVRPGLQLAAGIDRAPPAASIPRQPPMCGAGQNHGPTGHLCLFNIHMILQRTFWKLGLPTAWHPGCVRPHGLLTTLFRN